MGEISKNNGLDKDVVQNDPRTWGLSSKSRVLDMNEFALPDDIKNIFANGEVDSIMFISLGLFTGLPFEDYPHQLLIRSGDTSAKITNDVFGAPSRAALTDLCDMNNIALLKNNDGSLAWIARDGNAYDLKLKADTARATAIAAAAAERTKLDAIVDTVANAIGGESTGENLRGILAKIKAKVSLSPHETPTSNTPKTAPPAKK